MKKQLNTTAVINELKGASAFFPSKGEKGETESRPEAPPPPTQASGITNNTLSQAGTPSSDQENTLEEITQTVKQQGKEVTYVRLTRSEKNQLADIVYSYKRQGIKTTETEIGRIAINYLMRDYRASGKASILVRLLASLHVC